MKFAKCDWLNDYKGHWVPKVTGFAWIRFIPGAFLHFILDIFKSLPQLIIHFQPTSTCRYNVDVSVASQATMDGGVSLSPRMLLQKSLGMRLGLGGDCATVDSWNGKQTVGKPLGTPCHKPYTRCRCVMDSANRRRAVSETSGIVST